MIAFIGGNSVSDTDVTIFGPLRMWAERGLIHIEDSRDGSYDAVSVRVALTRMRGISEMLGNSTQRDVGCEDQFDRKNRKRHLDMLETMSAILNKAKIQGMPSDPTASRDLARRSKKQVVVPGYGGGL